jgi:hypothetical protein
LRHIYHSEHSFRGLMVVTSFEICPFGYILRDLAAAATAPEGAHRFRLVRFLRADEMAKS